MLEDVGCLLRLLMLGKIDPSFGRLSPSQQSVVDALRKSVRREKDHGGAKKDLGASKAGDEAHVVADGPGLKVPANLAAFLAYWLTLYIFPEVAPEPNDFGADDGGGEGEPCRNVCRSARWSGSGVRDVRGNIADVLDIEEEFVVRPYVNTPKGVFPFNMYSEEDVVAFTNKDDASTAELFRMSCMMRGELPYFVNGKYGSVTYDPMRVARQFGFDQGVPKSLLPLGVVGDVWKRFLKSTFSAELRSMNTITLPGAKRMGGCTKLFRKYWRDNLVRFLEYVKGAPVSLEVEDVMFQDGELCLPKVRDPALASFGARSLYVKEEVLGRVREYLKDMHGILEKDVGSSASRGGQEGEGRAKGVRLSVKHTTKRPGKDAVEVAKPGKRKKTSKGNEEISKAASSDEVEEVVKIPRVEVPVTQIGGGSEMPSNSLEVTGVLDQDAAAHRAVDDIWGDERVSSGGVPHRGQGSEGSSKVIQPDMREEAVKTRVGGSETVARGGLEVPLDSLEVIGTFEPNAAVHGVMNDIWGDERGSSGGIPHPWQGKSLRHMRSSDVERSEEEEEEEMGEEEEEEGGSEDDNRDDDQEDEEEGEGEGEGRDEEAGLEEVEEDQVGFDHVEGGGGGESSLQDEANKGGLRSSRRWWKEGDFMIVRYPDGRVTVTLDTKEKVTLEPGVLFAEAREKHRPLLSDIYFQWPNTFVQLGNMSVFSKRLALISLVSFVELLVDVRLPKVTPEEFTSVYADLAALGGYQLEVDWLKKRIDEMASLLELLAWRDRLERVTKELEDVEAMAERLRKRKKKLEGEVAQRESASTGVFDMSSHAGQGLRR
ncbi:hypothetical protein RHMOL_Rhmol06G0136000 [Rhododendron molle]|uniref:Uncharacterized protein n=1 Tax=Rhododendron molle TaxID=49168 RepID=A0ACC0ND30_RHOML|nr:hypothetical protein RHMOL_Rhmol06G0136000 [Rhododendron molle]